MTVAVVNEGVESAKVEHDAEAEAAVAADGVGDSEGAAGGGAEEFPADTAVAGMTDAQKAAYWKAQSKKQEKIAREEAAENAAQASRLAEFERQAMSDREREIADARAEARAEALAEAAAAARPAAVTQELRARGYSPEDAAARVALLDLGKFFDADGEIVASALDVFAPVVAVEKPQSMVDQFRTAGGAPAGRGVTNLSPTSINARRENLYGNKE